MPAIQYQVQQMLYDSKSMLDETNFYNQRQGTPSELTRKITYIMGDYNKNYPISTMTLGKVGYSPTDTSGIKELDDVQFTYPIMGRDDKASVIARSDYITGQKPGLGGQPFFLYFTDNWIKRFFIIESSLGIQCHVLEDPTYIGDAWRYKVVLDPALPTDFCPVSETQGGTLWADLYAAVAESESRSTESKMAMPGLYKNQMGFIRAGHSWAGNAANKVMKISIKTDKGETSQWMDFALWQFEKRWLNECEHLYWYSRYNRAANGAVNLKDLITGKVIPRGSGLLEQIQNKSTFSRLTYRGLFSKIGDALYGQSDTENQNITLYTGRGGLRDFDRAMKEEGFKMLTDFTGVADKFVSGSGRDLMLGGFFSGFYHIDGYTIKVKHNPMYDMGKVALKAPIHPETGFSLESHRLTFIDDNDYDGQPNIQHVAQKGRAFLHGVIPGLAPMPQQLKIMGGGNLSADAAALLATDQDKTSYTRMKSGGVQMLRANKSFDMQCKMGLVGY